MNGMPPPPAPPSASEGRCVNDYAVFTHIEQFTSEIVAESGNPADKCHLGKMVLKGLREHPDAVNQIDDDGESEKNGSVLLRSTRFVRCLRLFGLRGGEVFALSAPNNIHIDGGTGESETNGSVLLRSTRLASCMQQFGLRRGDVIALLAPNHIHVCVPLYAALYLGVTVMPVDRTLSKSALTQIMEIGKPKMVFCQNEKASNIQETLNQLNINSQVITFDNTDVQTSLSDFMEKYADKDFSVDSFKANELCNDDDVGDADTVAALVLTSGTTGAPKAATLTHKTFAASVPYWWCPFRQFPTSVLVVAQLQWVTSLAYFIMTSIYTMKRIQSSSPVDIRHYYELINKYKPPYMMASPTVMTTLLKRPDRLQCDFTCLEAVLLGGSAVSTELVDMLEAVSGAKGFEVFGMTELAGPAFMNDGTSPRGSCGRPHSDLQYRLIDSDSGADILEPFTKGELWVRGPAVFKGYYNNAKETATTFSEDGWFHTGDLFYRDAMGNYFYVERLKMLFKYKTFDKFYKISPLELEGVIRSLEDVVDAVVTSVPHPEHDSLAVACVVRRAGSPLTSQDIKQVVKENLPEWKQLHGGVIFLEAMPVTSTTKLDRMKIRELAATAPRE